jgi:hypothetical protein
LDEPSLGRRRVLVALVVGLFLVGLFVPVVIGLAVGLVVFYGWGEGARVRRVVRDVLVALRALTLPLLAVALIGAFGESRVTQLIVGVVVAAVLVPWLLPREWAAPPSVARVQGATPARRTLISFVVAVIAGAVLFVVVLLAFGSGAETFDEFGGLSTSLAVTAAILWCFAAAFRLFSFGTTAVRLVAAVLALCAALRALLATGVVGFKWDRDSFPEPEQLLLLTGFAFAVCVVVEAAGLLVPRQGSGVQRPRASAWGLGAALVSTLFIVLALVAGAIQTTQASKSSTSGLARAERLSTDLAGLGNGELALTFLPVLRFDRDALWRPHLVDDYLEHASLTPPESPGTTIAEHPALGSLETSCANPRTDPCFTLTLRCPAARPDGGDLCPPAQATGDETGVVQDGAVYARVFREGDRTTEGEPYPLERVGPESVRNELFGMVQYWFFYDYDEWVAPVLGGRIVQRHEGDWEAVTVGFARDRPLFVAFSQHCGGTWQLWNDDLRLVDTRAAPYEAGVDVTGLRVGPEGSGWPDVRALRTHAAVDVAVGSQANYPPQRADTAPNFATCEGFPSGTVTLLSYTWNIRDRTGSAYTWIPRELRLTDATEQPMSFPGTWGAKDTIQFVTTFDDPDRPGGRGPRTPTRQPLWLRPMRQIFCARGWKPNTGRKNYRC